MKCYIIGLIAVLSSCSSVEDYGGGLVESDIEVLSHHDFAELEIDIDRDGKPDLFGELENETISATNGNAEYTVSGVLYTENNWKILSKRITRAHSGDVADGELEKKRRLEEVWPVYRGESISESVCQTESRRLTYQSSRSLAFTAKSNPDSRLNLLASGALASGMEQYVALMNESEGKVRYAWVEISIDPLLELDWEDKRLGVMGDKYICRASLREVYSTGNPGNPRNFDNIDNIKDIDSLAIAGEKVN